MVDFKEISDEELKSVIGGKLMPDAQEWFSRNEDELKKRFIDRFGQFAGFMWAIVHEAPHELSLADLKRNLSEYFYIDDLK